MNPFDFNTESINYFMQKALHQAQKALQKDEVPIGAVVVNEQGIILAQAHNLTQTRHTQAAHAEMLALSKAGKKIKDWRLQGCWIFVTLQPCAMCMNMIKLSRCAGVAYAVESPLFGYHLDNNEQHSLYKKDIQIVHQNEYAPEITKLLKEFFQKKRKQASE
jgi:tRNA(adenine34) deaminase